MQKLNFADLQKQEWKKAVVVFEQHKTWKKEYDEAERSYYIYKEAKFFDSTKLGNSLFGDCVGDENEKSVRLDLYMYGEDAWKVDCVYIVE